MKIKYTKVASLLFFTGPGQLIYWPLLIFTGSGPTVSIPAALKKSTEVSVLFLFFGIFANCVQINGFVWLGVYSIAIIEALIISAYFRHIMKTNDQLIIYTNMYDYRLLVLAFNLFPILI